MVNVFIIYLESKSVYDLEVKFKEEAMAVFPRSTYLPYDHTLMTISSFKA